MCLGVVKEEGEVTAIYTPEGGNKEDAPMFRSQDRKWKLS